MTDCQLCNTIPLLSKNIEAYLIGLPVPPINHYLRINNITSKPYTFDNGFTPNARLTMSQVHAQEVVNHKYVWNNFLKQSANYAIVFNTCIIKDSQLSIFIENNVLPKDWDIILITDTQYIINKRAARILLMSLKQIHVPIKEYLLAFEVLKVIRLKW